MSSFIAETRLIQKSDWAIDSEPTRGAVRAGLGENEESGKQAALLSELMDIVVDYLHVPNANIFGESEWRSLAGRAVSVPPPPPNIEAILQSQCPFDPTNTKTVGETHMLVCIPLEVNGKPLTVNRMEAFAKSISRNDRAGFQYFENGIKKAHGDVPLDAGWALMTRDVIEGSRYKSYKEQQEIIRNNPRAVGWEVPSIREAIVCIFANFIKNNLRTFNTDYLFTVAPTFTRCREQIYNCQIITGSFGPVGLVVDFFFLDCDDGYMGVAGLRKFLLGH